MDDRNPSPPPEFEDESDVYRPDIVGGTAISKQWVLTTLMDIINEVDDHSKKAGDYPVEVSDDLQDAACKLWDVCVDQEVAVFLLDFDIIEILYGVILKSKSPRLTEISVGILGNMACSEKACDEISKLKHLRSVVLALLASSDLQTLTESVRLLRMSLSNESCRQFWIQSIKQDLEDFIQNCQFILSSSTNAKLLSSLSEMLDLIYEEDCDVIVTSCTLEFVGAMLEAVEQQMKDSRSESLHDLSHTLHALHTISQSTGGRVVFAHLRRSVMSQLSSLCYEWSTSHPKVDYNDASSMSSSEVSVSCLLSIASDILDCDVTSNRDDDNRVDEVDDEDREMIIKFARSVLAAKGVMSALTVMSSGNSSDINSSEFKTPLYASKNSPRISTPLLGSGFKANKITPESDGETPVQTPEIGKTSPYVKTPSRGEVDGLSPTTRERERDEQADNRSPAIILCDLARQLLANASQREWTQIGDSQEEGKVTDDLTESADSLLRNKDV
ncbi:protein saal1-like [Clavelina lepadiformis]|uniref:protein saal1-like n=1 Tax=Clavelina lepadiformis TaxID=159417 RepID=UPI0040438C48